MGWRVKRAGDRYWRKIERHQMFAEIAPEHPSPMQSMIFALMLGNGQIKTSKAAYRHVLTKKDRTEIINRISNKSCYNIVEQYKRRKS
jgi:hypothetical protein